MKIRTLTVDVYRTPGFGDCTCNGISARFDRLALYCPDGPNEVDSEALPDNFAVLENRHLWGSRIVPTIYPATVNEAGEVVKVDKWWMMGGNFAHTSDSRFYGLIEGDFYGAVAIHDRYEG